jgi:hypothetical protein
MSYPSLNQQNIDRLFGNIISGVDNINISKSNLNNNIFNNDDNQPLNLPDKVNKFNTAYGDGNVDRYTNIMNSYSGVVNQRTSLDAKLQELYGAPGSINDIYSQQYDTTMYMSIVWTVLATSLLYFVFIKL